MIKKRSVHKTKEVKGAEELRPKPKINWSLIAVVAALAGILLLVSNFRGKTDEFKNKIIPAAVKKVMNDPKAKFEVVSVKDVNGVYEFQLKIDTQSYTSYITKDGKILFTSGVKLDEIGKPAAAAAAQGQAPPSVKCEDIKKVEKPTVTTFIVANCPYGLQTQRLFKKVLEEAPGMAENLDVKYIGAITDGKITSMHGDEEAQENLRQICIRDEQSDLYWPYVNCYMQEGKVDQCLTNVGVDTAKLTACTKDAKRGLAFAQKDFDVAKKFNVSGSPTLLVNNSQIVSEFDYGGRVPNGIKSMMCCAGNSKGDYCANDLSTKEMATSFSLTDEAAAPAAGGTAPATNAAAGCAPATSAQ